MNIKLILISITLLVSIEAIPIEYEVNEQQNEKYAPPQYKFNYGIHDEHTGDIKSHEEIRNGHTTEGKYEVVDPDGHKRTVQYLVNGDSGFNAVVHREPINYQNPNLQNNNQKIYSNQQFIGNQEQINLNLGLNGNNQRGLSIPINNNLNRLQHNSQLQYNQNQVQHNSEIQLQYNQNRIQHNSPQVQYNVAPVQYYQTQPQYNQDRIPQHEEQQPHYQDQIQYYQDQPQLIQQQTQYHQDQLPHNVDQSQYFKLNSQDQINNQNGQYHQHFQKVPLNSNGEYRQQF